MKNLKRMHNSIQNESEYNQDCTTRRIASLIIDYAVYYLIYVIMIMIFYIKQFGGVPEVSADILYNNVFSGIIQTTEFSLTFLGVVLIWEIIIPLINNGQSISKKILKIKVNSISNKKISLILRGIIKIIVLNPYGLIAYLIGTAINKSYINLISNILSVVFIICVIIFFKTKKSVHDRIANTYVSREI